MKLEWYAQKIRNILKKNEFLETKFFFLFRYLFSEKNLERKFRFSFCSLCGKKSIMLLNTFYKKKKNLS